MKITIDCRMIDSSGIGVYLRECLPWFLKTTHEFMLLGESAKLHEIAQYHANAAIIECSIKPFSMMEILLFPQKMIDSINKTDIFYSPYFNIPRGITIPIYTTIHDMVFADMPEIVSYIGYHIRMYFFRKAEKKSTKIFTVSNFSKSRIEYNLATKKPVIVTYSAIQPSFIDYMSNLRTLIKKNSDIIFIGNIKKQKGLGILIDAFIQAVKSGLTHRLIIVGNADNFRSNDKQIVNKLNAVQDGKIIFTGFISQHRLLQLIAEAALLIQPSLYEGFGLPPLEAMFLGTSVLLSDIPVFKEIYADFPINFFKTGDVNDLQEKMVRILKDDGHATIHLSDELMDRYSFYKTSKIILEALS